MFNKPAISDELRTRLVELAQYVANINSYKKCVVAIFNDIHTAAEADIPDIGRVISGKSLREVGDYFRHPKLSKAVHRSILLCIFDVALIDDACGDEDAAGILTIMYGDVLANVCKETFEPFIASLNDSDIYHGVTSGHYDEAKADTVMEHIRNTHAAAKLAMAEMSAATTPPSNTIH